jgi:EmrB/QacA subfamily drug resistance transporter
MPARNGKRIRVRVNAATWVLIAAVVGSAMTFIDGSAVNVALPIVQRDLHATSTQMQWVVEGYSLFLAALILLGGSLGDLYGRRRMFVAGIVLFGAASLACGLAPNIVLLIVARCVQGAGAALAMPESLALISANFSGEARGKAIGTWSGFASITAALGPVLGGWLAQHASWRYVFFINLPLALIVLAIALTRVPESRDEEFAPHLDLAGAVLATLGLGALTYGFIEAQGATNTRALVAVALGASLLGAFVWVEKRAVQPMMPLALFRSRAFAAANLYTFGLYAAIGGALYFLPFALIDAQGYSPTAAGAALLPFVVLQFGFARWSGGLMGRIGARIPLLAGALIAAVAFSLFALPGLGGTYWNTYFPAALVLGVGGVLFVAPLTTTVLDAVATERSGIASGINNAVARTAGLLAVAAFGIVFAHFAPAGTATHNPLQQLAGFRAVMWVTAALCALSALLALAIPPRVAERAAAKAAPATS